MGDFSSPTRERALPVLTPRELDVLRRTAIGRSNADVAADLGVTVHAVKFHLASIFRKLAVRNRTEAAAWYLGSMADWPGKELTR